MGACLEGPPPLSLPLGTLGGRDRKCRPLPPSCPGGTPLSRPACPRRDRGPIEPALRTGRDNSHTEDQEHRRHACSGSHQPAACPPPHASPALLTFSSSCLFQDDGHVQNDHFVLYLLPRGSLLCAKPMLGLRMREESYVVSVPGEGPGRRQQAHRLSGVPQCFLQRCTKYRGQTATQGYVCQEGWLEEECF